MQAATAQPPAPATQPSLPPNHHIIQQKRIERLQEQLKAQLQCTKEAQGQSDALAEQVQLLKGQQKAATHRQFQARYCMLGYNHDS